MTERQEEPKEDHQEDLERESEGSRAIETESDTEDIVNDSLGVIVGMPCAYFLYTPKLFVCVQNDVDDGSRDGMVSAGMSFPKCSSIGKSSESGWMGRIMIGGGKSSR